MDRLKRPLQIPPRYPVYADKHDIKALFSNMMEKLLLSQPADPLQFLVDHLRSDRPRARVAVVGPPGSGKTAVSAHLTSKTGGVHVTEMAQMENELIERSGYVVDGVVAGRKESLKLQENGHLLDALIVLDANDAEMLKSRQRGKRRDPITGVHYHPLLNWPTEKKIIDRLDPDPFNFDETAFTAEMKSWGAKKVEILEAHPARIIRIIDADQPLDDIHRIVYQTVAQRETLCEKRTARAILLGPPGSGKRTIARMMSEKWGVEKVDVQTAIDTELLNQSRLAKLMTSSKAESGSISIGLIVQVIEKALSTRRAASHGWILFNFPLEYGDQLVTQVARGQFTPNRIVLFNQDLATCQDRLSYRLTDPITGNEYHQLFNPPPTTNIKSRCVTRESDKSENVKDRYKHHTGLVSDYELLMSEFGGFTVNSGTATIETVFETVESKLNKPLPTQFH